MPNLAVNASASSADRGAVPDVTARMLARSSRVRSECNTIRKAAGTSDTACGRCLRTASAHRWSSKRSNNAKGLASADALQHAEDATDMHHRGVDDRDPLPQFCRGGDRSGSGPITLRASMS